MTIPWARTCLRSSTLNLTRPQLEWSTLYYSRIQKYWVPRMATKIQVCIVQIIRPKPIYSRKLRLIKMKRLYTWRNWMKTWIICRSSRSMIWTSHLWIIWSIQALRLSTLMAGTRYSKYSTIRAPRRNLAAVTCSIETNRSIRRKGRQHPPSLVTRCSLKIASTKVSTIEAFLNAIKTG